jgi:translation initiation factor 2B subunit (eIF-2B alpha/beta/delta family)
VRVLLVDALGEGTSLARRLRSSGVEVCEAPESGLASAVVASDLVLVEASVLTVGEFAAVAGSRAAASVARQAKVPVWVVAGVGRVLPARLGEAMRRRLESAREHPWDRDEELVPLDLADQVVGPDGPEAPADAAGRFDCPVTPELLRQVG